MTQKQELVLTLSEGYSTQSEVTNRFWIVLIVSSLIGLVASPDEKSIMALPFTLGNVNVVQFYSINIVLISVVIIAFSSAMLQLVRTRILIQKVIDRLDDSDVFLGEFICKMFLTVYLLRHIIK